MTPCLHESERPSLRRPRAHGRRDFVTYCLCVYKNINSSSGASSADEGPVFTMSDSPAAVSSGGGRGGCIQASWGRISEMGGVGGVCGWMSGVGWWVSG